jgi:hypothetical protein
MTTWKKTRLILLAGMIGVGGTASFRSVQLATAEGLYRKGSEQLGSCRSISAEADQVSEES